MGSMRTHTRLVALISYGLLAGIAFLVLLPLFWMVSTSLKIPSEGLYTGRAPASRKGCISCISSSGAP